MGSIQDRWFTERTQPDGRTAKKPTSLHGSPTAHRWRAHYRTPDGRQRNKTFARKVDAERFLTTIGSTKLSGSFVDPARSRVTLGEMAEKWCASKINLKASTRARYNSALNTHVLPRWARVPLGGVATRGDPGMGG
jgi:hypothetical protein